MRSVANLVVGLVVIAAVMLAAVPLLEEIGSIVAQNDAVQALGWDSIVPNYQAVVLRWLPALWIIYLITWGIAWAIRKGRTTGLQGR